VSVKKNIIANYVGQGWRALMGLAFVPLYIEYLGIEAYGLIGIFAVLQAWLALLDFGMKPALGREMGRLTGGSHTPQSIRDLLRTIEVLSLILSGAIAAAICAAADWLATEWITAQSLPAAVVAAAFCMMGIVTALRFVEGIYVTTLVGLQRQVLENVATSILATARGAGAVGVLAWVSPTIEAFFVWQALMSLLSVGVVGSVVYRVLPGAPRAARFSWSTLTGVWHFAAGMVAINLLALLFTQLDKILLSRILTLEAFGYYAFAGIVVGALSMVVGPITTAFYPRFTELATRGDEVALRAVYHLGAQMVSVLVGASAVVLILFADRVLLLWTGNVLLAREASALLAILAAGTLLNGLIWIPYQVQLAHGWTSLTIRINSLAVVVQVPAILWAVPNYGPIGAAWVWVLLNAGCLLLVGYSMHRHLLRTERRRWYLQDVAIPLAAAAGTAWLLSWALPRNLGRLADLMAMGFTFACVVLVATLAAPLIRSQVFRLLTARPGAAISGRRV